MSWKVFRVTSYSSFAQIIRTNSDRYILLLMLMPISIKHLGTFLVRDNPNKSKTFSIESVTFSPSSLNFIFRHWPILVISIHIDWHLTVKNADMFQLKFCIPLPLPPSGYECWFFCYQVTLWDVFKAMYLVWFMNLTDAS